MSEIVEIIERTNKIINASGVVIEVENPNINYIVSESIPIIPSERLQITASGDYAHYIYAFYTAEGALISGLLAEAGGTVTEILAEEVIAPENAVSMLIAYKKPKQGIVVRLDVTPSDGNIKMQKIEDLPEATELNDTDIFILNTTTPQTKKFKIGTLLDYIKGKFESWSFMLKTSAQTIPAAIDELNDSVSTVNTNLNGKIIAEVNHFTTTTNWVVINKDDYYLVAAYSVRGDAAGHVKGINKRYLGSDYTIIIDGANNVEVDLYLIWAKIS